MAAFIDPDEVLESKREFQKSVDTLESARLTVSVIKPDDLLRARLDLWDTVDRLQSFERATAGHLRTALEVVRRSANGARSADGPTIGT
jgi:hypothetical protein